VVGKLLDFKKISISNKGYFDSVMAENDSPVKLSRGNYRDCGFYFIFIEPSTVIFHQ